MSKEFLSKCPEVIHKAEQLRTAGKSQEAINLVVEATNCSEEELTQLSNEELSDLMRAWRINVVANTSLAKRSWTGESAVFHLEEGQLVIEDYYNDPTVKDRAPQIKKDAEGNPYDFEVEMLRDKARYCLADSAITGDTSFRLAAINFLEEANKLAEDKTLSAMEFGIVKGDYNTIMLSYSIAKTKSSFLQNLDRARWMTRTFFGESLKRRKITTSLYVLKDLYRIRQSLTKTAADAVIGLIRSSDILSAPLNFVRRRTLPKNFNSQSLKIS